MILKLFKHTDNDVVQFYNSTSSNQYYLNDEVFRKSIYYTKYAQLIKSVLSTLDDLSVFDFGCGTLRYIDAFEDKYNRYVGLDKSESMIYFARKKKADVELIVGDISSKIIVNYRNSFNFIYSIGVLGEYIRFNKEILLKLSDLLKEDGFILFSLVDSESNKEKWPLLRLIKRLIKTRALINPTKYKKHFRRCLFNFSLKYNWVNKQESDSIILQSNLKLIKYYSFFDGKYVKHVYILKKTQNEINNYG